MGDPGWPPEFLERGLITGRGVGGPGASFPRPTGGCSWDVFTLQLLSAGWAGGDLSHSVMEDQGLQLGPRGVEVGRAWVWGGGGGAFPGRAVGKHRFRDPLYSRDVLRVPLSLKTSGFPGDS